MNGTLTAGTFGWTKNLRFTQVLWLMPAVFALHIAEEWFGGFPAYVAGTLHGSVMSPAQFIINNAGFMAILVVLSIWAARSSSRLSAFLLMAWASGNLFWDFVVHLTYTALFDKYSPGLITATLLYYPIPFVVTAIGFRNGRYSAATAVGSFAVGGTLMALVVWAGIYHFAL